MKLIKKPTIRKTLFSEIVYFLLSFGLVVVVYSLAALFDPPYLAYLVVLLSKWRVLAVRPRFWTANLQANAVDAAVGLSVVTLIWLSKGDPQLQLLFAALYAVWLFVVKPKSKRKWVVWQAGICQFVSILTLFSFAHQLPLMVVVLGGWAIGYICARHTLGTYDEDETTLLSMVWGVFAAELAWLSYHWVIAYSVTDQIKVPQIAILLTAIGFVVTKLYDQIYHNDGKIVWQNVRWPVLFALALMVMLLVRFSGLDSASL